jgi:hypothetical protein
MLFVSPMYAAWRHLLARTINMYGVIYPCRSAASLDTSWLRYRAHDRAEEPKPQSDTAAPTLQSKAKKDCHGVT